MKVIYHMVDNRITHEVLNTRDNTLTFQAHEEPNLLKSNIAALFIISHSNAVFNLKYKRW